jgi:hypothetical protein
MSNKNKSKTKPTRNQQKKSGSKPIQAQSQSKKSNTKKSGKDSRQRSQKQVGIHRNKTKLEKTQVKKPPRPQKSQDVIIRKNTETKLRKPNELFRSISKFMRHTDNQDLVRMTPTERDQAFDKSTTMIQKLQNQINRTESKKEQTKLLKKKKILEVNRNKISKFQFLYDKFDSGAQPFYDQKISPTRFETGYIKPVELAALTNFQQNKEGLEWGGGIVVETDGRLRKVTMREGIEGSCYTDRDSDILIHTKRPNIHSTSEYLPFALVNIEDLKTQYKTEKSQEEFAKIIYQLNSPRDGLPSPADINHRHDDTSRRVGVTITPTYISMLQSLPGSKQINEDEWEMAQKKAIDLAVVRSGIGESKSLKEVKSKVDDYHSIVQSSVKNWLGAQNYAMEFAKSDATKPISLPILQDRHYNIDGRPETNYLKKNLEDQAERKRKKKG